MKKPITIHDFTLIIPSKNRPLYIERIVNYYADSGLTILVCDSSEEPYRKVMPSTNIKYLHFKNYVFASKMKAALTYVTTNFVAMCAVDDFIVPQALKEGVKFLNENRNYSSVQGNYITFKNINGNVVFTPNLQYYDREIASDLPNDRLIELFSNYFGLYYAIHRTENFEVIFNIAIEAEIRNLNFVEIIIAVVSLISGKHKVLPLFYSAKESIDGSAGSTDTVTNFVKDSGYSEQYTTFINKCSEYLFENGLFDKQSAERVIRKAMQTYIEWGDSRIIYEYEKEAASSRSDIIKDIPVAGKLLLKLYSKQIGTKKLQQSLVKLVDGKKGFPFNEASGRTELKKIEHFVKCFKV